MRVGAQGWECSTLAFAPGTAQPGFLCPTTQMQRERTDAQEPLPITSKALALNAIDSS
jgi:hypothetical protein